MPLKSSHAGYGFEQRACGDEACPVDGVWMNWSTWTLCSASCGNGVRRRRRECLGPFNDGRECSGESEEHGMCAAAEECPVEGTTMILEKRAALNLQPTWTQEDDRPSAKASGVSCFLVLVGLLFVLVVSDLPLLLRHFRNGPKPKKRPKSKN
jgi:hypothetical protein